MPDESSVVLYINRQEDMVSLSRVLSKDHTVGGQLSGLQGHIYPK